MTLPYQKTTELAPLRVEYAVQFQEGLRARGYTGEAVEAALMKGAEEETTALACLLRAFALGIPTEEAVVRRELGEEFFGVCETAGLWARVEGLLVGSAAVLVHGNSFLLHDHGTSNSMYWVMGLGTSTGQVAQSVIRQPYESLLDLCCGGGVQGFLLAGTAKKVVAVDRNPRALNYGRFAAAMNGYKHVEFRESDIFSAVEGERFDGIVANPPYVLSPGRQSYYRDGGISGDGFARKVLTAAPGYLREDGFAFFVCDVASTDEGTSEERLRSWMDGRGCDVLAIGAPAVEAEPYARMWVKGDAAETARWMESFREIGVTSVRNWNVVLRRRSSGGPNWFRSEELPSTVDGYFGHQIERRFRGQDFVLLEEAMIWKGRLRLAPDVRIHRTARPEGARWITETAKITFAAGLMEMSNLDARTVDFLLLFDGTATMEEILEKVAKAMGAPPDQVRTPWWGYVKKLTEAGVLERVRR
jgi:methylase of polypeptide subunit release factors